MIGKGLTRVLAGLSIVLLMALMAVTGLDVIGRYFLNAPLSGAFELTELMLAALVFAALPLVGRVGGHVDVDIVTDRLPGTVQRVIGVGIAVVLLTFAWRLGTRGCGNRRSGRQAPDRGGGLVLMELAPGVSTQDVIDATEASLIVSPNLQEMRADA